MQVTEIVVSAGRTFNHPYENYSNLKPQVTIKAALREGEDSTAAIQELQAQAEKLVEDHKRALLQQLEELQHLSSARQEISDLEQRLKQSQRRLAELREDNPRLGLPGEEHVTEK
jgi:chromosome segregation ATPase